MDQWGTRSSTEINTLNEAIIEIIKSSIDWLAEGSNLSKSESDAQPRQPVRLGCRKLAYLLIGSANTTALNLRFHECPYWGALPYLSVRKIDRILRVLISRDILLLEKSPQLKLDVLKTNHDWNGDEVPDISEVFASERTLPLDQVDKNLLAKFKRIRLALSSRPYGKKSLPYIICSDRVLFQMCIQRPKDIAELRRTISVTDKFVREFAQYFINAIPKESD